MAELIDKSTMLDWVQKQVEAVTKKQVAGSDGIFTREVLTTMQRDLSAFENEINAMPTTTEAEIRAKALGVMGMAMKEYYPSCKGAYVDFDVFFHAVMAKVAEQMEEGAD